MNLSLSPYFSLSDRTWKIELKNEFTAGGCLKIMICIFIDMVQYFNSREPS